MNMWQIAESISGEWWLDDSGQETFADGDISDYNHMMIALSSALGVDLDDPDTPEIIPLEPLSDEVAEWLLENGADERAVEFFRDGSDPRDYAMIEMGWIRVQNNAFQMYGFTDDKLSSIRDFLLENDVDPSDNIEIEDLESNVHFGIAAKILMNPSATAQGIVRYKRGVGAYR